MSRRGWDAYLEGAAAFDLALVSLVAIAALGYRDAITTGLWVSFLTSRLVRSRGPDPFPRARIRDE
jgi:hypothetical protein